MDFVFKFEKKYGRELKNVLVRYVLANLCLGSCPHSKNMTRENIILVVLGTDFHTFSASLVVLGTDFHTTSQSLLGDFHTTCQSPNPFRNRLSHHKSVADRSWKRFSHHLNL